MPNKEDNTSKTRTRWMRWLAALCRPDKHGWANLLAGSWTVWATKVYGEVSTQPLHYLSTREEIKAFYQGAIIQATAEQLRKLDCMVVDAKLNKKRA